MPRLAVVVAISLVLLLLGPIVALADNTVPGGAITLGTKSPVQSGEIRGDSGGAVRFFGIDYAGNGLPVTFNVTAMPSRNVTGLRFGFKLNGPSGFLGEATEEHRDEAISRLTFTLSSVTPGRYLVQVYNFAAGIPVSFNIQALGLAVATIPGENAIGPMLAIADNTTPQTAVPFVQPAGTIFGALLGQQGGSFHFYRVEYPGMNQLLSLSLGYSPPSPFQNSAVGFDVYDSSGKRIAQGLEAGRDRNSALVSTIVQRETPDTLTIQVLNYQPELEINYSLRIGSGGYVQR